MLSLLERLRDALAPHYTVERELASGGMGMVFLGRDVALQRRVAIKIIRPELATAQAAERFLREARILANLSHPNIVPVHHVGEAGGIFYYVMDYLEGETLSDRLDRGALSRREVVKLGRDVLDALEASHRLGVVHRDIKPSNVFLIDNRAVLADFGIAKPSAEPHRPLSTRERAVAPYEPALTAPGAVVGTLDYMPPEQAGGAEVTPRTDLYAIGMVLYEALTGRHWPSLTRADRADWSGVPRGIARVLRRALEWKPEDRWRDAASFRRALWRTRVWPYRRRTIALTVGGVVAGLVLARVALWSPPSEAATVRIRVDPFRVRGGAGLEWLGDSLARALATGLAGYPDFSVQGPGDRPLHGRHLVTVLEGAADATTHRVRVEVQARGSPPLRVAASGPAEGWRALADSLSGGLFELLVSGPGLDSSFLSEARPKTRDGLVAFIHAEHLFTQARWGEAYTAYAAAAAADTSCWLCYWRHAEVGRWLGVADDRAEVDRYVAHVREFPPHYQRMIRSDTLPLQARLDTLEAVTERWPEFLFGRFRLADELVHRGPLLGHPRREAVSAFQAVLRLRPDFAPAWEHLAWVHIADGDSAPAAEALAHLRAMGEPRDLISGVVRALLELAFAWRFQGAEAGRRVMVELARQVERAGFANIDAGARYLPYYGAPEGAVEFGRFLEPRASLQRSALLAQAFGHLGLGHVDSARAVLRRLADRFGEPGLGLFADELEATLVLFDSDSADATVRAPRLARALADYASLRAASADVRRRAAWMVNVLTSRFGTTSDVKRYRSLLRDEPGPQPMSSLLGALDLAADGRYAQALKISARLSGLEPGPGQDPFLHTVVHLSRAMWYERQGETENARRELLWHENSAQFRYPTGDPQPMEVDWAFGTLALWRIARLLERSGGPTEEICRAYRDVARLWAGGEPRYAARADSAARRFATLGCSNPT